MKKISVLIVENSGSDEELLLLNLRRGGYDVDSERVESAEAMRAALAARQWDIVISDYTMPTFTGTEAHRVLRESGLDIPFIMVSGSIGEEIAVQAMLAGINDYLMKDNLARLVPTVERELKSAEVRRQQRGTKKALDESAERYRSLFENANDTIYTVDLSGNYTSVNKKGEELTGYSREEILQSNFNDFLSPGEAARVRELSAQKINGGIDETRYELEITTKNGTRKMVEVSSRLIYKDGVPSEIQGIARDITERKEVEQELQESVEDFRALVKATSQSVWEITDGVGSVEFLAFWQELTGQNYEESKDFGWLAAVHAEDREETARTWHQSFTMQTQFDTIYRILTVGGGTRYFAVRGVPVLDENGSLRKWIGTFTDITERKQLDEELRQSEARLQLSQQEALIGTWEWNLVTGQTSWSEGVWRQLGLRPGAIRKTYENYLSYVHPEDRQCVQETLARVMGGDLSESLNSEFRMVNDNGKTVWLDSKGSAVLDSKGKVERLIGVTIDITARKTAEENLHASEEKLRQAQKLESIGRLAGGIAHDFNNMLTAINGYSDLILQRLPSQNPLFNYVEEIKKAGEHSATLTHQLLAFSRRQILQPKILDINRVISDTFGMLQRLIGENIQLNLALNPEIGQIEADPGQISQVIMNLAVNSRDAMQNGGIITIATENVYLNEQYVKEYFQFAGSNYVLIIVSDTGSGVDEDTLEHIFEPFYTTKAIGKGTGLGLATVYGIVKQSGGHINVVSAVGAGTTFEIYLPRVEAPAPVVGESKVRASVPRGGETILVVEDEQIVRTLTCEILKSYGYKVLEAGNGEEALAICKNTKPEFDLLLTDVVMPRMGGYELAEKLLSIYPKMRTVFASGYTEDVQSEYDIDNAATDFIHKPFTPDSLAAAVRKLLDLK